MSACKKESTPAPAAATTVKTYSVLYKFTSTSSAADFEISYLDATGLKTVKNQSSGWTYTTTLAAGSYVSISGTGHTVNAEEKVQIYYDNTLLDEKEASGAGTYAYVLASGTLPN